MSKSTRNRGFALMIVLILLLVAVVIGMNLLNTSSVKMKGTHNYSNAIRAQYLAESAIQYGLWVLQKRPDLLESCNNKSFPIDGGDSCSFNAIQDPADTTRYTITGQSSVGGVSRSCTSTATVGQPGTNNAMVVTTSSYLPLGLKITGNVHVNGSVVNLSRITGTLSTTVKHGLASDVDPYHWVDQGVIFDADYVQPPVLTASSFRTYTINGVTYTAAYKQTNSLSATDPMVVSGAITNNNIGRILYLKPAYGDTVSIASNLNFQGTIVVEGNVAIAGGNIKITPCPGFPAIVTDHQVKIYNTSGLTVNGVLAAKEGFWIDFWTPSATVQINGMLVSQEGLPSFMRGTYNIKYDARYCNLYDFSGGSENKTPIDNIRILNFQ